jgi:hypothetical protein
MRAQLETGEHLVYDLAVDPPHTYFAGGLLVHNKAAHVPLGTDPDDQNGLFYRRASRRP